LQLLQVYNSRNSDFFILHFQEIKSILQFRLFFWQLQGLYCAILTLYLLTAYYKDCKI